MQGPTKAGAPPAQGPGPLLVMHISKTAGTTLRTIVSAQFAEGGFWTAYSPEEVDALRGPARAGAVAAVMGHFNFGLHELFPPGAKYITLFRDPVSQVISSYNHIINSDGPLRQAVGVGGGLADFLEHDGARNLQTQYLTNLGRAEIERDPDFAFRRAREILDEHFVCFGITERFVDSLQLFAHRLGWRIPPFDNLNTARAWPKRITKGELGASLLRRVWEANACDVRLYHHAQAAFQEMFAQSCPLLERVAWRSAHWARCAERLPRRVIRRVVAFGRSRGQAADATR